MKEYKFSDGWVIYVPEFDGNRDEQEPITVEIKALMVKEAQQRTGKVTAKRVRGGGFQTDTAKITQKQFTAHVKNITNLTVNGTPVTTGEELLNTPLHELVDEINEAISDISMLNEGDIKNFGRRSDGFLERVHGTATNVTNNVSETGTAVENTEK